MQQILEQIRSHIFSPVHRKKIIAGLLETDNKELLKFCHKKINSDTFTLCEILLLDDYDSLKQMYDKLGDDMWDIEAIKGPTFAHYFLSHMSNPVTYLYPIKDSLTQSALTHLAKKKDYRPSVDSYMFSSIKSEILESVIALGVGKKELSRVLFANACVLDDGIVASTIFANKYYQNLLASAFDDDNLEWVFQFPENKNLNLVTVVKNACISVHWPKTEFPPSCSKKFITLICDRLEKKLKQSSDKVCEDFFTEVFSFGSASNSQIATQRAIIVMHLVKSGCYPKKFSNAKDSFSVALLNVYTSSIQEDIKNQLIEELLNTCSIKALSDNGLIDFFNTMKMQSLVQKITAVAQKRLLTALMEHDASFGQSSLNEAGKNTIATKNTHKI